MIGEIVTDINLLLGVAKMVPKVWQGIAGLFGKEAPKSVVQAGKFIDEIQGDIESGAVPPEQQVELRRLLLEDGQIARELEFKRQKLDYDDAAGGREVIKTDSQSEDPVVRQARPKMMMRLGNWAIGSSVGSPVVIGGIALIWRPDTAIQLQAFGTFVEYVLWVIGMLWSSFTVSFTGYIVGRTVDKKIAKDKELGIVPSRLLEMVSKLGHKIS